MCTNIEKQLGNLLVTEEPMVVNLLTEVGAIKTPAGEALITLYDDAATDVQNWKSGSVATEVIEVVQQADVAFNDLAKSLPIPPLYTGLADIISAGLTAALAFISGNSQPPGTPVGTVAAPAVLEAHQKATMETALAVVKEKTGYSPSHWEMAKAALGDPNVASGAIKSRWKAECIRISKPELIVA